MKKYIIGEIKKICGNVGVLPNGWCFFIYRHLEYVYIPSEDDMIRISIPHVVNSKECKKDEVDAAVNETNREVKFIKAMVLNNGSISLNYDYRTGNEENVGEVVPHMIQTLFGAAEYMKGKLQIKKNMKNV